MSATPLQFWFEFASTYSYLSASRVEEAAAKGKVPISWEPFLLGPIFKEQSWEDSPFNIYPAKGRYMWRDMERLCADYGIPFRRPSQFPRSGLTAARVATLASNEQELWLPDFVRAVFTANFAEDKDISDRVVIREILESLGLESKRIIEVALSPKSKEHLRKQTERAKRIGIFGAPSFVVGEELFWGNDRLDQAIAWHQRLSTIRRIG